MNISIIIIEIMISISLYINIYIMTAVVSGGTCGTRERRGESAHTLDLMMGSLDTNTCVGE